ncbi:hypothetical protein [Chryseobacterium balustinum]|uniref:hypothetical protein n=1 Tax=Chryseobacterium balustinum TaxID=246 RepID=UPI003CF850B6
MKTLNSLITEAVKKINSGNNNSFQYEGIKYNFKKEKGFGIFIYSNGYNFLSYDSFDIDADDVINEVNNYIETIEIKNESFVDSKEIELKIKNKEIIEFNESQFKNFLKDLIPGYIGLKKEALSGSEYISINNKNVRFADHIRPINSKWNNVHLNSFIDAPSGLLTKENVLCFLAELNIENYNIELLEKTFAK